MKTTIDLPDALVKQLKLRALKDGRKLKDAVADLLRVGLAAPVAGASKDPQLDITKDRKTGLPVIRCPRIARRGEELTPERVANILNDQEGEWVLNLPDTNVWLALSLSGHDFHSAARDWFARQVGDASVLFCRSTQQSLLRLLTTEAVMRPFGLPSMSNAQAWHVYTGFESNKRIGWIPEPRGVEARWKKFATRETASPKLWMDAYLAAFSMAGGYQIITSDKGFKQFEGLNPVILLK